MVDYFGINLQGRDGDEGHMDLEYKQRYVARCAKQRRKMLSMWLNRPVCLVLSANKDITVLSLYGEKISGSTSLCRPMAIQTGNGSKGL